MADNKRSILVSLIPPLFGTIVPLVLIEIVVRFLGMNAETKGLGWTDRPKFYMQAPGAPTMQGLAYSPEKPPHTYRIAVIGDSFTFAPYMQFTDTFVSKLEQMLNINRTPDMHAEVINYGVPAYSTSHEIAVTEKAVKEHADLIILQITLNDPELKAHRPTGIREDIQDRFGKLAPSGALKWLCDHWKTLGWVLTRLHNSGTRREYVKYFNDLYDNPRTWNPFVDSMKKLVATAQNSNVPIIAVVFPLFGLPMDKSYPFYPIHEKVNNLLAELQVPHEDLSDIYKDIPLERLQVIPGEDRHPNEIAHRMAAEEIYSWLERERRIPTELTIKDKFATRLGITDQRRLEH